MPGATGHEETMNELTPIEEYDGIYLKRDDLYRAPGTDAPGGKARTCYALAKAYKEAGLPGLVTAGSRSSPQVNIVAQIGKALDMKVRVHTPQGEPGPEVIAAINAGAERVAHKAGYNSVIVKRAEDDAAESGWGHIPFGMQCREAIKQTAGSFENVAHLLNIDIASQIKRLIVPVGSGMSLCGVMEALRFWKIHIPVLGVVVGASPEKRLDMFTLLWRFSQDLELVPAGVDYHTQVDASIGGVKLDPIYEAKCAKFLEKGDLLWIVGIRQTAL
jgi:1-aminocyclopropane-1-carboxylate deaminase/D-cysteine desulfhydrase-like pyridoxal-dependent ACC family enzyme